MRQQALLTGPSSWCLMSGECNSRLCSLRCLTMDLRNQHGAGSSRPGLPFLLAMKKASAGFSFMAVKKAFCWCDHNGTAGVIIMAQLMLTGAGWNSWSQVVQAGNGGHRR